MGKSNRARVTAMAVAAILLGALAVVDRPALAEESAGQKIGATARSGWEGVKEAWESTKEATKRAWNGGKEVAKDGWDTTKDKTKEVTEDVKDGWKKNQ